MGQLQDKKSKKKNECFVSSHKKGRLAKLKASFHAKRAKSQSLKTDDPASGC